MSDYIPNPANYTMKGNKPLQPRTEAPFLNGKLMESDLAKLDTMSKDALIRLIKAIGGAIWGIGLLTPQDQAEASRLKLITLGLTSSEAHKVIPALDKWFDRTEGKAPQSIAMTVKQDPVSKLSDDQLAALLANLPNTPMVIPPKPKKPTA